MTPHPSPHASLASLSHASHALTPVHHQPPALHHPLGSAFVSGTTACLTASVAKQLQMIEQSSPNQHPNLSGHSNDSPGTSSSWLHPHPSSRLSLPPAAAVGHHVPQHHLDASFRSGHSSSLAAHSVAHHHQAALHAIHALHESLMFSSPSDSMPSSSLSKHQQQHQQQQQQSSTSMASSSSSSMMANASSSSSSLSPSSGMIPDNTMNGLVLYTPCIEVPNSCSSSNNFLEVHKGKAIRLRVKVLVPVQDHPNVCID